MQEEWWPTMQKIGTKAYRMQKGEHPAFLHSGTNKYVPGTTTHIRVHLKNLPTTHIVFGKAYCILTIVQLQLGIFQQ